MVWRRTLGRVCCTILWVVAVLMVLFPFVLLYLTEAGSSTAESSEEGPSNWFCFSTVFIPLGAYLAYYAAKQMTRLY